MSEVDLELEKYELSLELAVHTADVKCVKAISPSLILSGSRDLKVVKFDLATSTLNYYTGHTRYVNSINYMHNETGEYILSGSSDKSIKVHRLDKEGEAVDSWKGHANNVVSLDILPDNRVVSTSWDMTAIIWNQGIPQVQLSGHSQAVWCVKVLRYATNPCILTGSADKTVKVWSFEGKLLNTFQAHTDCVRGIDEIPGVGYATCSNDSSIKVWTYEHLELYQLFGHTSFIYSVKALPGSTLDNVKLVSGGEDRCIRIWQGQQCTQTLGIPSQSIWSVDVFENEDIVTGSCDGIVRLFTKDPSRKAEAAELEAYHKKLAEQSLSKAEMGAVDPSKLSDKSTLQQPGTKEGQVKMVKENGSVLAYQWDSATGWNKVGEVVDAVGSKRKQLYQGKEYDYVFEINMEDGMPNLKLPYNATENPFTAAMNFINRNNLPQSYVDQVADFITKNSEPVQLSTPTDFVDPYTGASRYVANPSTAPAPTPAAKVPTQATGSPFPILDKLQFTGGDPTKILNKLVEFNTPLAPEQQIDAHTLAQLQGRPANAPLPPATVQILVEKVQLWPLANQFPILDLLRVQSLSQANDLVPHLASLVEHLGKMEVSEVSWDKPKDTLLLVASRLLTNLLSTDVGLDAHHLTSIHRWMELLVPVVPSMSPNTAVAFASISVNLSNPSLLTFPPNSRLPVETLQLLLKVLPQLPNSNLEANYRILVGLGNLICRNQRWSYSDKRQLQLEVEAKVGEKLMLQGKVEELALHVLQINTDLV